MTFENWRRQLSIWNSERRRERRNRNDRPVDQSSLAVDAVCRRSSPCDSRLSQEWGSRALLLMAERVSQIPRSVYAAHEPWQQALECIRCEADRNRACPAGRLACGAENHTAVYSQSFVRTFRPAHTYHRLDFNRGSQRVDLRIFGRGASPISRLVA